MQNTVSLPGIVLITLLKSNFLADAQVLKGAENSNNSSHTATDCQHPFQVCLISFKGNVTSKWSASTESISSESSEAIPSKTVTNLEWDAEDQAAVDKEFNQLMGLEIITNVKELEEFYLVRYWQVFQLFKNLQCNAQANFWKILEQKVWFSSSLLHCFPAQASAVPSERVFSSSKETDSQHHSNLSPKMMEILQILKYLIHSDRLNCQYFTLPHIVQLDSGQSLVDLTGLWWNLVEFDWTPVDSSYLIIQCSLSSDQMQLILFWSWLISPYMHKCSSRTF